MANYPNNPTIWGYLTDNGIYNEYSVQSSQIINNSLNQKIPQFVIQESWTSITVINQNGTLWHYNQQSNNYFRVVRKDLHIGQPLLPNAINKGQPVIFPSINIPLNPPLGHPNNYVNPPNPQFQSYNPPLYQGSSSNPVVSHQQVSSPRSITLDQFLKNQNSGPSGSVTLPVYNQNQRPAIWEWEDRTVFQQYDANISQVLENAFLNKLPEVILENIRPGIKYKIVLTEYNFMQHNMETGHSVRVKRRF